MRQLTQNKRPLCVDFALFADKAEIQASEGKRFDFHSWLQGIEYQAETVFTILPGAAPIGSDYVFVINAVRIAIQYPVSSSRQEY